MLSPQLADYNWYAVQLRANITMISSTLGGLEAGILTLSANVRNIHIEPDMRRLGLVDICLSHLNCLYQVGPLPAGQVCGNDRQGRLAQG